MKGTYVQPKVLAHGFAMAGVASWALCVVFTSLFPRTAMSSGEWLLHGLSLKPLGEEFDINIETIIMGGLVIAIGSWIYGYILGWSIDFIAKKTTVDKK